MDYLWYIFAVPVTFFFGIYILLPVVVILNPWLQTSIVFLHYVKAPFVDYTKPKNLGYKNLKSGRCFHLSVAKDVKIGVWHILPESVPEPEQEEDYVHSLKDGKPIFIYLHGTAATRAHTPRVNMLKRLSSMDNHVFSIDYRGFADSSGIPTEEGVVEDALSMYKWVQSCCGDSPIIIWGHSLGTGVATLLVRQLCNTNQKLAGLVLESPFNNLREAASQHPLSLPFRFLPWFERAFLDTAAQVNINFESDKHIAHVTVPIMIVHSKDDNDVPIDLGRKLYEAAVKSRPEDAGPIQFYALNKCGHINISQAPEFPHVVRKFLKTCGCGDSSVYDKDYCDTDIDWKELSLGTLNLWTNNKEK
ncbi:lysophosphatidylserine lipase ABHD12-like [Ylistrum balloti]|uniref:lysophosphatidylserine lipase ABHD12-like n=1 Tax=Ylistrum balloti TaxID=509963 RepID=UPI002905D3DD|nr:lysophosphatidylserine lipase ABHD12-like [Ylistrum balloti]